MMRLKTLKKILNFLSILLAIFVIYFSTSANEMMKAYLSEEWLGISIQLWFVWLIIFMRIVIMILNHYLEKE